MRHTNRRVVITASQKMLDFANLPGVNSAQEINDIFLPIAYPFWNPACDDDEKGMRDLTGLHKKTRRRLIDLMAKGKKDREKILREIAIETGDASAQADVQGVKIPLPYRPEIAVDRGAVVVHDKWLVTGAEIAVTLGLLELFLDGLVDDLARCRNCEHFYLETPKLHVACSPECKRKLRNKAVAKNVKRLRNKRRRSASREKD